MPGRSVSKKGGAVSLVSVHELAIYDKRVVTTVCNRTSAIFRLLLRSWMRIHVAVR